MPEAKLRSSQLISTFGPGAMVDLPDEAVIVGGLNQWRYSQSSPLPLISEPRLQRLLAERLGREHVQLRCPPTLRKQPGATSCVTCYRFPQWFVVQETQRSQRGHRRQRLVHGAALEKGKFDRKPVVPVRWVRACRHGHVGDIDWHRLVHDPGITCWRNLFIEERGTSGDLDSVWIACDCGASMAMTAVARRDSGILGECDGSQPWLDNIAPDGCGAPSWLLIRSASNAYFPQKLSVISIPDELDIHDRAVAAGWERHFRVVATRQELDFLVRLPDLADQLKDLDLERVWEAIQRRQLQQDGQPIKTAEFLALTRDAPKTGRDASNSPFYARPAPMTELPDTLRPFIERVVLVHRLREVVAQVGFTRFEASVPDVQGELDLDIESAPLGINEDWLPAYENRGEGIFVQFKPEAIAQWQTRDGVNSRAVQLRQGFARWRTEHPTSKQQFPGVLYYMLHSVSHLLLVQIALDCGYPLSSLRERIYMTEDGCGILIYTAATDADGTLGGLVAEGHTLGVHLLRALEGARLCANDPICAAHNPSQHDQQTLLGAACHGCLLVPETCCEQRNDFLDRQLVIPTLSTADAAFFGER